MPASSSEPVQFDDVMDALRALEREPGGARPKGANELGALPAPGKLKAVGTVH